MRSFYPTALFSVIILFNVTTFGQNLEDRNPLTVSQVSTSPQNGRSFLPMDFAESNWTERLAKLGNGRQILAVSLVYTQFRTSPKFNQKELNRQRMAQLGIAAPQLFNDPTINWKLIEQTDGKTQAEAKKLFHGFIIDSRPKPSPELTKTELSQLSELKLKLLNNEPIDAIAANYDELEPLATEMTEIVADELSSEIGKAYHYMENAIGKKIDRPAIFKGGAGALFNYLKSSLKYPESAVEEKKEGTVLVAFTVEPNGNLTHVRTIGSISPALDKEAERVLKASPKWSPAKKEGVPISSNYTMPILFDLDGDGKAPVSKAKKYGSSKFVPFGSDQVVSAVLERNKWKKMAIVCDLTGSMSPYTGQLLSWFKLHANDGNIFSFTFFNDGNEMKDRNKKIGTTGGTYYTESHDLDSVFNIITTTMSNGAGGDVPENNLEAALVAQANCPDCEIVLISDNFATPRDLRLVGQIKATLHVIACGATTDLNMNYLQLAYSCSGTVHTLYQDVNGLADLENGSTVSVGLANYELMNNGFFRVRD